MDKKNEAVVQRYVDILTNGGFKALFGDVNNKDVVISILNVLLPEHRQIAYIDYLPTELQGPVVDQSKEFHYDFMCRDESGTFFIVELQKYWEDDWFKRCVSYASRAYDRQNRRGQNYDVPPVYLIGLMDIEVGHPDVEYWKDRYVSEYTFREKESHDLLAETIVIIFAEMAHFDKRAEECVTETDRMLYVLKFIGRMMEQPAWLQNEVYTRIFSACEIAGFPEDKRIKYEQEMNDEKRLRSEYNTARRMGLEEGLEKGREEGREEARLESALKFKQLGVAAEIIAEATGLSVEEVCKLGE
jgi:predicted transposase/invertase (TIGR01784 family)